MQFHNMVWNICTKLFRYWKSCETISGWQDACKVRPNKSDRQILSREQNAVSQHGVEYIQSSLDIGKVAKQFQGGQSLVK